MISNVSHYIKAKRIDSIQKLQFLLFLSQNPRLRASSRDLAFLSFHGSAPLVEQTIGELQHVGLIEQREDKYQLSCCPDVRMELQALVAIFADPLYRQQLIYHVRQQRKQN